jgi:hypothetical protein
MYSAKPRRMNNCERLSSMTSIDLSRGKLRRSRARKLDLEQAAGAANRIGVSALRPD